MQCVHIGQDHKCSNYNSGRDASKRAGEGVHRRDETFQSRINVRVLIVFADQHTKFVFVDMLKAKREALASLKKFVLSVGTPMKLRQDNAKEFFAEQFEMCCLNEGLLQEKIILQTPQLNRLAEVKQDTAGDFQMIAH